jgi:hypothetical protein
MPLGPAVGALAMGDGGKEDATEPRDRARLCRFPRPSPPQKSDLLPMADQDEAAKESARLWKVNRTIHELVRDRVSHRSARSLATGVL